MKNKLFYLLLCILFTLASQAQDLSGFQKLRGEIISSDPEDSYSTHAYNAFDTNKNTTFKSRDQNGWIGLDLKESTSIRKIRVYPRSDRPERMNGCVFQGSNDADFSNSATLYTITQTLESGKYTTYEITTTRRYRYVRCISSPDQHCNLAELEFYTDEEGQTFHYPQLSNLPTIYLETKGNFNFVDKSKYATSKVIISDGGVVNSYDAGVRGRGNSTWDFMEKKPFRIKFDKKQHFLDLPANAKSWVLLASAVDKTFLRNGLAFEISKFLGFEFTPSCVYVDVVLDGFYYGTFVAGDHIGIDKNRINIDEMEASDIQLPELSGGYHLEIDAYASLEPVYFYTKRGVPITIKSPDEEIIVPEQQAWITNHINQLEDMLYTDPEQACEKYIDIESAVKYYLLSELTGNCDSYWCIHTFKKREDDKLYFGPVWDYDQAFLTNERVRRYEHTLSTGHGVAQNWFRIIMQTKAANKVLNRLWKKVMVENLEQQLLSYIDENAALLQQSQELNYERWNCLNRKVWFEDALFDTYDEYTEFVKEFIQDRIRWFNEEVPGTRIDILPSSARGNTPREWKYSISDPNNPDWFATSYNDSDWEVGLAPFGTEQGLQNTLWEGEEIYIRQQFYVEESTFSSIDKLYMSIFHDEDCWIYINDELVLELRDYITSYQSFEIDKSKLQPLWNTIAIKCVQTIGGQLIDAGIYASEIVQEPEPDPDPNPDPEPEPEPEPDPDPEPEPEPEPDPDPMTLRAPEAQKQSYKIQGDILIINNMEIGTPIIVYGIDGKLIKQQRAANSDVQIQLPCKGMYLINVQGQIIKVVY